MTYDGLRAVLADVDLPGATTFYLINLRGNGLVGAKELNTSGTNTGGAVNTFPFPGCDINKDVFALCAAQQAPIKRRV